MGARYTQPQTPVEIDRGNPLARGISIVSIPGSGARNLANPNESFSPNFDLGIGGIGRAIATSTTKSYSLPNSPNNRANEFTAIVLCNATATLGQYRSPFTKDWNSGASPSFLTFGIEYNQSGAGQNVLTAFTSTNTNYSRTSNYTIPDVRTPHLSGILRTASSVSAIFNGNIVATNTSISAVNYSGSGANDVWINSTYNKGDFNVYLVLYWTRALTAVEIKSLSDNPWQIFKAPQRRIWVAGTSSGSTGTVAVTNANDTSSASGATTVTGSVAKSNANDTSAASGTTTITGSLARTNVNDTSAASGTPTVIGTLAKTNANDTSAASGTTTVVGTLATTNAKDTVSASGAVGNSITGTVAYTNANDTLSASGTTTIVGTVSGTNANDTSAANGTTTIVGTFAKTNANDTVTASGIAGAVSGTVAYTNANDISTASGTAGSQASGSAPDYSVGKKKKFVVKVGDRLVVFSNQVDAINALPDEVREPVKVKQYPAKKKSASAKHGTANLQKPDSVPVAQPDETVPLQTVSEMAQAYNAQAQYDQLMRKMQYEALYSLYQDLLEEDDSEALLMVA